MSDFVITVVAISGFCHQTYKYYRGECQVSDLVWLTLIWDVPPSFQPAQPLLPIFHQPRQNLTEAGTGLIKFNPTQSLS